VKNPSRSGWDFFTSVAHNKITKTTQDLQTAQSCAYHEPKLRGTEKHL